jgi:hypothetical protein
MSVDAARAGADFYVSDVLTRAWRVFIGNLPFFLGITLLIYVAIGVVIGLLVLPFALAGAPFAAADASGIAWGLIFIVVLVGLLVFFGLNTIGEAVLLLGAFRYMRGQPIRVSEALRRGFARVLSLVGLGILSALGLMAGFVLLIVPCVILLCMWWVAVPACVVEGLGPVESLSRSSDLTRGYRWKVFGLVLLLWLINGIGSKMVEVVFALGGDLVSSIGSFVSFVVWTAFSNCVLVIAYHDLRVAKEGIDTEQIAAVFD